MALFTVNRNPSPKVLRGFGKAMLIGFGVLGAIIWMVDYYRAGGGSLFAWTGSRPQTTAVVFWSLGILLAAISYAAPAVAKPIYVIWMTVANYIGIVMSTILLTLLFVLLLPIFSIIVRRTDPLRKRLRSGDTYWEDYNPHEATIERLKRPF